MSPTRTPRLHAAMAMVVLAGVFSLTGDRIVGTMQASLRDAQASAARQTPARPAQPPRATDETSNFDIDKYFAQMEDDVSVYDPASPWIYEKTQWRRRVDQMMKIRQFLDLNPFHRTEVELGDMRVVTVYREIRRVEGSMTSRLHGRITWVYLKRPDGQWWLWHDHTSEIPEDFTYEF